MYKRKIKHKKGIISQVCIMIVKLLKASKDCLFNVLAIKQKPLSCLF